MDVCSIWECPLISWALPREASAFDWKGPWTCAWTLEKKPRLPSCSMSVPQRSWQRSFGVTGKRSQPEGSPQPSSNIESHRNFVPPRMWLKSSRRSKDVVRTVFTQPLGCFRPCASRSIRNWLDWRSFCNRPSHCWLIREDWWSSPFTAWRIGLSRRFFAKRLANASAFGQPSIAIVPGWNRSGF